MAAKGNGGRIEVTRLCKSFGQTKAVNDLSFTVEPGTVTGFLGPNGAGKTTTLRMLLGLVNPDSGQATINGRRYVELESPSSQVGAVLEASGFHPGRSARNHLRVYCTVNGYPASRADQVLDMVGLAEAADRKVGGYSLGMRQRLALAAALLGDPGVLLLDEPANGLDPEGIVWMRRRLRDFAAEGRTVLVSSHVLSEMQQLVDHVVIIDHGRLVQQGPLADLSAGETVVLVRTPQVEELKAALGPDVQVTPEGHDGLRIIGVDVGEVGRIARERQVERHTLTTETRGLEEAFFALTAGAAHQAAPPAVAQAGAQAGAATEEGR
jgi:ABC-2 type transport system ATP-binding protein